MAWIESHDDMGRHPKTKRAARMLGVSIPTVMGHLHLLWHWCLQYAEDGDLSDYDAADIADAVMWDGEPDTLIDALLNCGPGNKSGFLSQDSDGRLVVHDWMDYAGRLVQSRQESSEAGARGNHERWHAKRGISDPNCPFCVEEAGSSGGDRGAIGGRLGPDQGGESGGDRVLSHPTVPYPTVHNSTGKDRPRSSAHDEVAVTSDGTPGKPPFIGLSVDDPFSLVSAAYHAHVGVMGPTQMQKLQFWYTDRKMPAEVMVEAIAEYADRRRDDPSKGFDYLEGILRNWSNGGVATVEGAVAKRQPRGDPRVRSTQRSESILERDLREAGVLVD